MSQQARAKPSIGVMKTEKDVEFNPRWKGYVFISLTSLVNFASISNISRADRRSYWAATMVFGVLTFGMAVLVLVQDRSQKGLEVFHYTKARDGQVEGISLVLSVLWWVVGVAYITRAGGIAYTADNIYYSSWLSLASCIYTLNEWSSSKDILSISELTGLSKTLASWWVLNLSSLVVLGTTIDLHVRMGSSQLQDTDFGIAMSCVSCVISFFFLLVHYDFFPKCEEGGWLELSSSFFLVLLWTVGLIILTHDEGIAATVTGSQCSRDSVDLRLPENCTVVIYEEVDGSDELVRIEQDCGDIPRQVPGSNLYMAVWICFFAAVNISLRWKAQQALQFAQAQQERRERQLHITGNVSADGVILDDDDEDQSDDGGDDNEDVVEI